VKKSIIQIVAQSFVLIVLAVMLSSIFSSNANAQVERNDMVDTIASDLADQRVVVNGTNVSIIPPRHFVMADTGFSGFYHLGAGVSMAFTISEGRPYVYAGEEFGLLDFGNQGAELLDSAEFVLNDGSLGKYFLVGFTIKGIAIERMVLFTGDYNNTIIVMANYPAKIQKLIQGPIKESFKTIKF